MSKALIPASEALIGAVTKAHRCILQVVVLDKRLEPKFWENPEWQSCQVTSGACFSDWMKGGHDMTPEWLFSEMVVSYGFANSEVAEQAIAAFATIEECAWARSMLPPARQANPTWRAEPI